MTDTTSTNKRSVAVIGGGITGLATAWYLQKNPTLRVQLFESKARLGGVIETFYDQGRIIELAADNFATLIPDAKQLTQELGLLEQFVHPNKDHRLARVVARGKLQPIPAGFTMMQPSRPMAILTSGILSWPGKMRLLGEWFVPKRKSEQDESLESFAVRRLGREAFERLVEPIVGGIFTADAKTLSMRAAMPQFWEMEAKYGGLIRGHFAGQKKRSSSSVESPTQTRQIHRNASGARYEQFMAPKLGMNWWIDSIVKALDRTKIQTNCLVQRIERVDCGAWTIHTLDAPPQSFDAVVIATPAGPAAELLHAVDETLGDEVGAIPYASSAVAVMVIRKDEIPKDLLCFGVVVPTCERREILAISFASEKYPGRVADDETLVRVFMGGAINPAILQRPDGELLEIAWRELQSLLNIRTPPTLQRLVRWTEAMPQYLVGHLERMDRIELRLKQLPGLAVAGNAYSGVGIPQCIRSGRVAAEKIMNQLGLPVMDDRRSPVHNQKLG